MTLDTVGIILVLAGGVLYFVLRKKSSAWGAFFLFVSGIGAGVVIGAIWALSVIDKVFGT